MSAVGGVLAWAPLTEVSMYALAINGSPRRGGNTEQLLQAVLTPLEAAGWQTELVKIGGRPMAGCKACMMCFERQDGRCSTDSDDFNAVFAKMLAADAIVLGSPTYFASVTAEMKALIDRSGYVALANDRAFKGKIGAAVVAVRRAGAVHVFDTINHLFQINRMIVPGSSYWNLGVGRDKGEVLGDAEGLRNMDHLGRTIAWLGQAIGPHRESFPEG